ncbi:Sulfite exporter TauE/SafE [Sulfitobacter sp. THAF37]|uniref:sulfite exporter TauE/SafE family protein n=1 Tax=Sulfitobacter sp. THAF37 TaxID=2587855 RepID=UPI001268F293|nr:sulfite exporter TauE/SafE family protein [Sulfitobacter sp. THAF37]QFT59454.1 Sulfite exporter TauE/SafE [Sulfitobacter sp. THAF37]
MPDVLAAAGSTTGLIWLVAAVIVAGLVRGFSGFGSAMIIMPVAASVLSPVQAVIFLAATELLGPLPNLRAAWRDGAPRDVGLLMIGVILALPLGLWCLSRLSADGFGWFISGVVLLLLALLISGWRYRGRLTRGLTVATGALGGFMTGFAGIAGPPVIMLYMASSLPIATIRANFLLYLLAVDVLLFALLWLSDLMVWEIIVLGLLIGIPNLIANRLGAMLFDPAAEGVFRLVAYLVIAASAIIGLPIWKGM